MNGSEPVTLPILDEDTTYTMWTTLHPAYMNYVTDPADLTVWQEIKNRTNIGFAFTAVSGITASDSFNLMMAGGDYCDIITEIKPKRSRKNNPQHRFGIGGFNEFPDFSS